jgi:hypothetical protein
MRTGITYAENTVYRLLPKLVQRKAECEAAAIAWAKQGLLSDLSLVLLVCHCMLPGGISAATFQWHNMVNLRASRLRLSTGIPPP